MKKVIGLMILMFCMSIGISFGSTIPNDAKTEKTFMDKNIAAVDVVMFVNIEVSKIVVSEFRNVDVPECISLGNEPISTCNLNPIKVEVYKYSLVNENIFILYYKTINKRIRLRERPSWTAIL